MGCREIFVVESVHEWSPEKDVELISSERDSINGLLVSVQLYRAVMSNTYFVTDEVSQGEIVRIYACDDLLSAKQLKKKLLSLARFE